MRGKFGEVEERPDEDLRERLHAMESKVRKMREIRNNFNDQAKVSADKRNSVQSQYKEHKEKIDLVLAEVKTIRAEIKMFKQKRNAIQAQMRSLFTKHKDSRNEHGKKRDASTEYVQLKQEVDALEKKFETSSVGIKKEKEMVETIKKFSRRIEELEPEVAKFELVSVDLSDLDSAIKTLKAEADAAHSAMIEAVERVNEKSPEVDEVFAHRDFLKSEGDRFHIEFIELKEKANEIHSKIDEMMVDVNKAKGELNLARKERKSWMIDHNKSIDEVMKTGSQSDDVAESLTQQLLETGSLTFGGINSEDLRSSGSSNKSKKKKNMRRINMNASRKR